jgi:hypothetical protein
MTNTNINYTGSVSNYVQQNKFPIENFNLKCEPLKTVYIHRMNDEMKKRLKKL